VVNPRQVRGFAKALGLPASIDRIDASVIGRFAETTRRAAEGYGERQERLRKFLLRLRPLVDRRTSEKNGCGRAGSPLVRKSVLKPSETLTKDIQWIERATLQLVESNDD
jgi:transposase